MNKYFELINKCLNEKRYKGDGELYFKHHILPRSLYPLLKNKKWNIVLLTASEHREAHRLLALLTVGKCKETMERSFNQYFGN